MTKSLCLTSYFICIIIGRTIINTWIVFCCCIRIVNKVGVYLKGFYLVAVGKTSVVVRIAVLIIHRIIENNAANSPIVTALKQAINSVGVQRNRVVL